MPWTLLFSRGRATLLLRMAVAIIPSPSGRGQGEGRRPLMSPTYRDGQREVLQPVRVKRLRSESTDAERLLWRHLRDRQLDGLKFRRQHQFERYFLDFFCPEAKLVVELDGDQHDDPAARQHDAARSEYLRRAGLRVVRFSNREVFLELEAVLEKVVQMALDPHPNPLPEGEGIKPAAEQIHAS